MNRAIGISREMICGVASREAHRKVTIDDRFWTIVSLIWLRPCVSSAMSARPPTIAMRVLNTLRKR